MHEWHQETDCTNNNWLERRPDSASSTFLPSLSELLYLLPIKLDRASLPLRNQLESNPVMSNDDDYLTLFFCETGLIGLIRRACQTRRKGRGSVGSEKRANHASWSRLCCGSNQVGRTSLLCNAPSCPKHKRLAIFSRFRFVCLF